MTLELRINQVSTVDAIREARLSYLIAIEAMLRAADEAKARRARMLELEKRAHSEKREGTPDAP